MTEFLSSNFPFLLILVLFALVVALFFYLRKTNMRLNKSIELINDLYKITQHQANLLEQLNHPEQYQTQADSVINKLAKVFNKDVEQSLNEVKRESLKNIFDEVERFSHKIEQIEHKVEQLVHEDPQLKMYNRANQLAKTGASIEDIVEACQLPHAEAEVLVSLHKKLKN